MINTICYPDYPTSYKPDADIIGHLLIVNHTSRLRSITYSFIGRQARHLRMFQSSMKIIQANYSGGRDPLIQRTPDKDQVKGVDMLFRRLSQFLTAAALAITFVAFAGVAGGSEAKAQGYYRNYNRHQSRERYDLRRHQRRERFRYGNSPWLRRHQQRERWNFRRHQRFERFRYNRPYRRW